MDAMPRPRKPYLHRYKTRHGKFIWYVRKPRGKRVRIRGEYGTPEFDAAVAAALADLAAPRPPKAAAGTLAWLWERYRDSAAWKPGLSAATRKQRENIMRPILAENGDAPYTAITRKSVTGGLEKRKDTPAQARNYLDTVRGLFEWAVKADHLSEDPTEGVKAPQRKDTEGFKAWTESDVEKYEQHWKEGTRQRVWLRVLLYTGVRRGDAVLLGKQHVRNGILTFYTEKGRDKRLIEVNRRIEPELEIALAQGPTSDLAFICGERLQPLTKESFGNMFKAACVEAGITDKSAHGLRKLSATIWAERGASEHELMALFGWLTPQMAAVYTRKAQRKKLALGAAERLARR